MTALWVITRQKFLIRHILVAYSVFISTIGRTVVSHIFLLSLTKQRGSRVLFRYLSPLSLLRIHYLLLKSTIIAWSLNADRRIWIVAMQSDSTTLLVLSFIRKKFSADFSKHCLELAVIICIYLNLLHGKFQVIINGTFIITFNQLYYWKNFLTFVRIVTVVLLICLRIDADLFHNFLWNKFWKVYEIIQLI